MHSAFNLFVFPNSMFTPLLLFLFYFLYILFLYIFYERAMSYEFFPRNYTDFRKDRNVNGGGVFVATSDRIISYEIPELDTDCQIVWAGLHFSGFKPLYLASFYKPPNTTSQPHWRPLHLLTIN